jgi:hypothetical protein
VERNWYGKQLGYKGDKHKEVADLFYNEMKISTAYPIMLFFCKYYEALQQNILIYLESEAMKAMDSTKELMEKFKLLEQSGDGLQA